MTTEERERIRALVVEGSRRQGLPPTIEERAVLSKLAAILLELDSELNGEASR